MTSTGVNPSAAALADADFARAMSVPAALLALRDEMPRRQWASRDLALNRSVVVLTVAAWQAWVETYVRTALEALGDLPAGRSGEVDQGHLVDATRPLVELGMREVRRFSTPDSKGVRGLLRLLGDDPRERWRFAAVGGQRNVDDVTGRLDDWLKVRHAIAHGAYNLPTVAVLGRTKAGHGSLTHRHAAHCAAFFRELAAATGRHD